MTAIAYLACDISKDSLQFAGTFTGQIPNDADRVLRLLRQQLRRHPGLHVVGEPTGGQERTLVAAARTLGVPYTLVDAFKARHFALGLGWLEKSDPLDAALLLRYASVAEVKPTPPPAPDHVRLREWVQLREHYVGRLAEEKTFGESLGHAAMQQRVQAECHHLAALIEELEVQIATFLETEAAALQDKVQTLCLVEGLALRTATGLLAHVPELGALSDKAIAKLVGVAPIVDDSGLRQGHKHIARGRAPARRVLYQAALVAAVHNEHLRPFYRRLRDKGKPAKLALIAVARKLLCFLNSLLKPAFLAPV